LRFGYSRCSSIGQSLDIQIADLNAHACERIVQEKVSGKSIDNRPELKNLLDFMRKGDELYCTRVDRLARSTLDLCNIVKLLEDKECVLVFTQQPFETRTTTGRLMLQLLGVISEFENSLRRERQMAGIEVAKANGVYARPRTPTFDHDLIRRLYHDEGVKPRQIAKRLGASVQTIYRVLDLNAPNPVQQTAPEDEAGQAERV
jgi:DNA invertase Pin-like site-specific DNA recombinase